MTGAQPARALAAVATQPLTTELRKLAVPSVRGETGLLAVEACGVCGTDWAYYRRERGAELGPMVLGHEIVGRISELGAEAARRWALREGDRVALEEFVPCGTCRWCRAGHHQLCSATDSRGTGPFLRYGATPLAQPPGLWGGFAESVWLHPRAIIHPVPDAVSPELATLFVPISNGLRWLVREAGLSAGESVVIIGAGQHGLGAVVAAREVGAAAIVAAARVTSADRLDVAAALGATRLVPYDEQDLARAVRDLTGGEMADVALDVTAASIPAARMALSVVGKRGRVVLAGGKGSAELGIDHDDLVRREVSVRGVRGHDSTSVRDAIAIIAAGRYPLQRMATHRFGLRHVDAALRAVGSRAEPGLVHAAVMIGA